MVFNLVVALRSCTHSAAPALLALLLITNIFLGSALYKGYGPLVEDFGSPQTNGEPNGLNRNNSTLSNNTSSDDGSSKCKDQGSACNHSSSCSDSKIITEPIECEICSEVKTCNLTELCAVHVSDDKTSDCNATTITNTTCPVCVNQSVIDHSESIEHLDVLIPHFLPKDVSRHRIIQQQTTGMLTLHVFTTNEINSTVCYENPVNHSVACLPRIMLDQKFIKMVPKGFSPASYQVTMDFMVGFELYQPTSEFVMVLEDDCSICEQAITNGHLSSILQFMSDNNVKHIVTGPGACGHMFHSRDIKGGVHDRMYKRLVVEPRDKRKLMIEFGDLLMTMWARDQGIDYVYKYNLIWHHDGPSMTWNNDYYERINRKLARCGELQNFFLPTFNMSDCWNVPFSPCYAYNTSRYTQDAGHSRFRYNNGSAHEMLGKMAIERYVGRIGGAITPNSYKSYDFQRRYDGNLTLIAVFPDNLTLTYVSLNQSCDKSCSRLSLHDLTYHYDESFDLTVLNDCTFLNSAFNLMPRMSCGVAFQYFGPCFPCDKISTYATWTNSMLSLSAFSTSRSQSERAPSSMVGVGLFCPCRPIRK